MQSGITIRRYGRSDRDRCLAVFDTNVPGSFLHEERAEYAAFLDALPGPYYVLEDDAGTMVACGGYAVVAETGSADLCWGMVALSRQGTGLGRMLTHARISAILADPSVRDVALKTSQHTRAFYEKLGFITEQIVHDGIAPGLHRCDMRLHIGDRQKE
jgi:predicted GNAT family N-acyltransferase